MATVQMPAWATETAQTAAKAVVDDTNTKVTALGTSFAETNALVEAVSADTLSGYTIIDVTLNGAPGFNVPTSQTELAELLSGATISVSAPGFLTRAISVSVTSLVGFRKRILVPTPDGASFAATVALNLGRSPTCAYLAEPVATTLTGGAKRTVSLLTRQFAGAEAITEVCRIQPWTSTGNDNGDSWLGARVTTVAGTQTYYGYYDANGNYQKDCGIKVGVWTVPADAQSISDCEETFRYGTASDTDIFTLLKVLREEKIVDVTYTGDSESIVNKFVRFSPVWVKTTFGTMAIPVKDSNGNVTGTQNVTAVTRWYCDVQADSDYHLHSAFVRYTRNGDNSFSETPVPHCYISRYPINNANLTCGGSSRAIAVSRSDGSNEVGNTRDGFLSCCRDVNNAAITVSDPANNDEVLLTLAANADSRAMSMIDLPCMSLVEDLAYLLFGVDSQSGLRGVSVDTTAAKAQQANGVTDFIAALGIKLGGISPTSNAYNFNFMDIEGGTWSAPGCMFPNYTSVMERITTTDAEGVATSTTRNRYLVAIDRADYNPGSSDVDGLLANGYRWVSFNVGNKRRIGLDDTQVMRDAKLFSAAQGAENLNYAGVDEHWQGGAPSAIASYSASATYAVGAYVIYENKLYQCSTAVETAEAFDSSKWTLKPSATIASRSLFLVARGISRGFGAQLGAVSLSAIFGLAHSAGAYWRSRLSFQPLPAANDE